MISLIPDIDLGSYINHNTPQKADKDIKNIIRKLKHEPNVLLDWLTDTKQEHIQKKLKNMCSVSINIS